MAGARRRRARRPLLPRREGGGFGGAHDMVSPRPLTVRLMEAGDIYRGARPRVVELVSGLSPEELGTVAPGTPLWTVKDIVGHLTGVPADVLAGRTEGAGSPEWTGRQVAERKDKSLDEVLGEWSEVALQFEPLFENVPQIARTGFDVLVHEHDIRGALGISGSSDPEMVDSVLQVAVNGMGERLPSALRIRAGVTEWVVGPGSDATSTVTTDPFQLFRTMFGRPSNAQVS